jgi:hypothetical protein
LRCGKARAERQRQQRPGQSAKQFPHGFLHFHRRIKQPERLEKATLGLRCHGNGATVLIAFYSTGRG